MKHIAFHNRYNRARRVVRREFLRGNKNYNFVGPEDVYAAEFFDEWGHHSIPAIKPHHVATAARRRKFRKERKMKFNNPTDGL